MEYEEQERHVEEAVNRFSDEVYDKYGISIDPSNLLGNGEPNHVEAYHEICVSDVRSDLRY